MGAEVKTLNILSYIFWKSLISDLLSPHYFLPFFNLELYQVSQACLEA